MERQYKFEMGQRVRTYDKEDQETVFGTVVDYTRDTVFIKWDDLNEPCEHERHEYAEIHLVRTVK